MEMFALLDTQGYRRRKEDYVPIGSNERIER